MIGYIIVCNPLPPETISPLYHLKYLRNSVLGFNPVFKILNEHNSIFISAN